MKFIISSADEWQYPDIYPETSGNVKFIDSNNGYVNLTAAKNGSAAFQVRLTDLPDGASNIISGIEGTPDNCGAIRVKCYRELPVKVKMNTGVHGFTADWAIAKDYATREAPFEVYDALEPIGANPVTVKSETEVIYVSLQVDRDAPAGSHSIRLDLSVQHGDLQLYDEVHITVNIEVADVTVPEETLYVTNWYSVSNMAKSHGLELWSEAHWAMVHEYGKRMRELRQNVFWVTWDLVQASDNGSGGWSFDFTHAERLITDYLGLGFTLIEGSPIFGRDDWGANEFKLNTPNGRVAAMSSEGYAYTAALLSSWREFLTAHGWYTKLIQHIGDEPHGGCSNEYRTLSGIVRKFLPGVRLIDAVETHELYGAVDIWVPKNDYYTRNMEAMEKLRSQGDELWFYTCCIPGGHYCNRLLDMPLLRSRMLHWGNYRYNITGYLHWGLNHWNGDPYENTTPHNGPTNYLPAGDTNIVYPLGDKVIPSMRGEQMKSGAEDYELLKLLAAGDKAKADEICGEVFRAFNDCDNAPEAFSATHDKLLKAF